MIGCLMQRSCVPVWRNVAPALSTPLEPLGGVDGKALAHGLRARPIGSQTRVPARLCIPDALGRSRLPCQAALFDSTRSRLSLPASPALIPRKARLDPTQ